MWLNQVATGVTILSHFEEERSSKGYLELPTGTRASTPSPTD